MIRIERENYENKGRFIIHVNDVFAGEMTFSWAGTDKFIIDHTGVEEAFSGQGIGKMLVMKAVEFAKAEQVKIIPLCPFAKRVFARDVTLSDVEF